MHPDEQQLLTQIRELTDAWEAGVPIDDWEYRHPCNRHIWRVCTNHYAAKVSHAASGYEYRRRKTLIVRTISYPEPMREAPKLGSTCFRADPERPAFYCSFTWEKDLPDLRALERGLLHSCREAAIAHGRAMAGVDQ